jgi:hypothetical protein
MADVLSEGCGTCTLCCKIMKVTEIAKPAHRWCQHCEPGKGCGIYDVRPDQCREWSCFWLQSQTRDGRDRMAPALRPDRSHVVIDALGDKSGLVVYVDRAYPGAWRSAGVSAIIGRTVAAGMRVVVATGNKRKLIEGGR